MEAICSSETPVETEQTTRRHIPEDDTLQVIQLLDISASKQERIKSKFMKCSTF
jgi:hypothetical protein